MKNFHSEHTEINEIKKSADQYCEDATPLTPTEYTTAARFCGWILYDGECRYCVAAARQLERLFARRGFYFLPLQTPWIQKRLGLRPGAPLEEMHVLTQANQELGGVDVVIFLAGKVWWTRPVQIVAQLPGARAFLDRTYRLIGHLISSCLTSFSGRFLARQARCVRPLLLSSFRGYSTNW
jgi:predicted DCC family thiol-disulfide oxidoreductase YuxK